MNRLFKYAMFFTAFIPLWITILFLDIMSITDETNNYIGSEVVGIGCIAIGLFACHRDQSSAVQVDPAL